MAGQIRHVFTPEREIQVTSLACGPAREVFDAFEDLGGPENFRFNLLDIDEQALDFLRNDLQGHPLESLTQMVQANLVCLALGRQDLEESFRFRSSGASVFTRIRDSKSSPAEKPRYSWVGRA